MSSPTPSEPLHLPGDQPWGSLLGCAAPLGRSPCPPSPACLESQGRCFFVLSYFHAGFCRQQLQAWHWARAGWALLKTKLGTKKDSTYLTLPRLPRRRAGDPAQHIPDPPVQMETIFLRRCCQSSLEFNNKIEPDAREEAPLPSPDPGTEERGCTGRQGRVALLSLASPRRVRQPRWGNTCRAA